VAASLLPITLRLTPKPAAISRCETPSAAIGLTGADSIALLRLLISLA